MNIFNYSGKLATFHNNLPIILLTDIKKWYNFLEESLRDLTSQFLYGDAGFN